MLSQFPSHITHSEVSGRKPPHIGSEPSTDYSTEASDAKMARGDSAQSSDDVPAGRPRPNIGQGGGGGVPDMVLIWCYDIRGILVLFFLLEHTLCYLQGAADLGILMIFFSEI